MTKTTTLLIARHGNTFNPGETPTRVGARTDLPLTESGKAQAVKLGEYLENKNLIPDRVFTSTLSRTRETASLALSAMGVLVPIESLPIFDEIDYGPDENQTDDVVRARVGEDALKKWDMSGDMPEGWSPRPGVIRARLKDFSEDCLKNFPGETILVVTSNGIARFALSLAENGGEFPQKLATGAFGLLTHTGGWDVTDWNIRP
jgi:2,3-bisphosphoglycerate-dependent phosphoglycerate mutase